MHYRWNFPEHNDRFLLQEFSRGLVPPTSSRDEELAAATQLQTFMRTQVIPSLGVTPESAPAIETAYGDLLDPLEVIKARAPACHRWVERMNVADAGMADAILEATGLAPMLHARPARRIERIGFTEVLGDWARMADMNRERHPPSCTSHAPTLR